MTLVEMNVAGSFLTGAIGGGIAGGRFGPLGSAAGAAAGAVAGMAAAVLAVAVTGLVASRLGAANESSPPRRSNRLAEVVFVLLVILVCIAPIWVPFFTYRFVSFFARA